MRDNDKRFSGASESERRGLNFMVLEVKFELNSHQSGRCRLEQR